MTDKTEKRGERQKRLEEPAYLGEEGAPAQGGRTGGRLPKDVGTRDELKRSEERPPGATRVRKEDEEED